MAFINYDITCMECGWHTLDTSPELNCERCKSEKLHTVIEFDEHQDDE